MAPDGFGRGTLSVVVPSVNGWHCLGPCLEALEGMEDAKAQVVVADRVGPDLRERVRDRWPEARLLACPRDTSIPALRARAFPACTGDVVGVIEDHVLVPPDWARKMMDAHRTGARVVGGTVENAARDRLVDRAAFLCEYSHCLNPGPAGPTDRLPGNNVTYRREMLERFASVWEREVWEDRLHEAFRDEDVELIFRPDIRVRHDMRYTAREYASQRFLYSRALAAMRMERRPPWARLLYALATTALPPVLMWRIGRQAFRSGRGGLFLRALPLLAGFVVAWAAGEAVGAVAGDGGALARVR